jgi:hypothetical protein
LPAKGELPPEVAVIVVRLKGEIQTIVGGEVAHQMNELDDAFISQADLREGRRYKSTA